MFLGSARNLGNKFLIIFLEIVVPHCYNDNFLRKIIFYGKLHLHNLSSAAIEKAFSSVLMSDSSKPCAFHECLES